MFYVLDDRALEAVEDGSIGGISIVYLSLVVFEAEGVETALRRAELVSGLLQAVLLSVGELLLLFGLLMR